MLWWSRVWEDKEDEGVAEVKVEWWFLWMQLLWLRLCLSVFVWCLKGVGVCVCGGGRTGDKGNMGYGRLMTEWQYLTSPWMTSREALCCPSLLSMSKHITEAAHAGKHARAHMHTHSCMHRYKFWSQSSRRCFNCTLNTSSSTITAHNLRAAAADKLCCVCSPPACSRCAL